VKQKNTPSNSADHLATQVAELEQRIAATAEKAANAKTDQERTHWLNRLSLLRGEREWM
jgi:hypothetical protein